jgi:hypothetical protein
VKLAGVLYARKGEAMKEIPVKYREDAERLYDQSRINESAKHHLIAALAEQFRRIEAKIGFPQIVCLCGSTRFYKEFMEANYRLTMHGYIVLSVGFYHKATDEVHGEQTGITPEQKAKLDALHLKKIDLADFVLVLDVDNYMGESTTAEAKYAFHQEKRVIFLSQIGGLGSL